MEFCLDRLRDGQWVHLYPEGKVNQTPMEKSLLPLRWGVGRMVAETTERARTPIVIPIYHLGMNSVLPPSELPVPRVAKRVTICIGEPIPVGVSSIGISIVKRDSLQMLIGLHDEVGGEGSDWVGGEACGADLADWRRLGAAASGGQHPPRKVHLQRWEWR